MLSLAKAESRKEMNLRKHKFLNDESISQNRNSLEGNSLYQNYKDSNVRIQHKLIKKTNIKDKNKILQKDLNTTSDSFVLPKNKYYIKLRKSQHSPLSSSRNRPLKKIVRAKTSHSNILEENEEEEKNLSNNKKLNKKNFKKKNIIETENEISNILKTTKSGKIRKLFSMYSNIFNLNNTATNYMNNYYSLNKPSYYKSIYKKNINDNSGNKSSFLFDNNKNNNKNNNSIKNNRILNKIKKKKINKKSNTSNIKPNTILGIGESIPKKKNYNKIDILNRTQYNIREIDFPLTSRPIKTNLSNIESVKYDIITSRKSNLFDKYNNLSGIKATTSNIQDYEILVPQNYNNSDVNILKRVFASNGIHVFGVKEEGDIIGGVNGKYKLKIRIDDGDEEHINRMINKSCKKLAKYDVELKRNHTEYKKRKTDITGSGWDKTIKYGLH